MIPGPASSANVIHEWKTEDGVMRAYGTVAVNAAPLTDADTWASGCTYILSLVAGTSKAYLNTGTKATPSWTLFGSVA